MSSHEHPSSSLSTPNEPSEYSQIRNNELHPSRIDPDYLLLLLREAVAKNDTPFVRAIFNAEPELLTIDDDGGAVTLWCALRNGNTEIATMLVHSGVDLSQRHRATSFLHWLIVRIGKFAGAEQLAELMIEHGADVDAKDVTGKRVLPMAIEINSQVIVEALLKFEAVIEDDDVSRAAFGCRSAEMLPMLLAATADVDTRKRRARTALWCYLCCQPLEEFSLQIFDVTKPSNYHKDLSLIRRIVQYAMLPQPSNLDVINVLTPAIRLGHFESVRIILEYKVDFRKEAQLAAHLFCLASRSHKSAMARLLIERGVKIDSPDDLDERQYPLHEACRCHSIQNIHLFLRLGADINVVDRNGRTPFSLLNTTDNSFTHHHQLFVKHMAVLVARGSVVNENDLRSIRDRHMMQIYYEECTNELQKMKATRICDDLTFFCFFEKSFSELTGYARRANFVDKYRTSRRERRASFPLYYKQMDDIFEIADRRKNFLLIRDKFYGESSYNDLPADLQYVERDYYFMLHDRIDRGEPGFDVNLLR